MYYHRRRFLKYDVYVLTICNLFYINFRRLLCDGRILSVCCIAMMRLLYALHKYFGFEMSSAGGVYAHCVISCCIDDKGHSLYLYK